MLVATFKSAVLASTETVPESPVSYPRVRELATAPELEISALPALLIEASVVLVGTPLLQFVPVNQLPLVPVQVVGVGVGVCASAGELQIANVRTANRQIRTDCATDLFFMICPSISGFVTFFVLFLVEAGLFEETMSSHPAHLAWPGRRSAKETVAEQLLVIHSADSLRRICKIFSRTLAPGDLFTAKAICPADATVGKKLSQAL